MVTPVLRVKDYDGNIIEIPAIKGDKGDRGEKGNGVPDVTTNDNGKILQVVDGVWTAVELPNGDEVSY